MLAPATLALMSGCRAGVTDPAPARQPSPVASVGPAEPAAVAQAAAGQVRPERPRSLTLPSGRLMPVDPAGTADDGSLAIPDDITHAGWWAGGPRLGDPFGGVVVAAHVDSVTQGVGPVVELSSARRGQPLRLAGGHLSQRYRVVSVRLVPRVSLRDEGGVFSTAGPRRLVVITCGGPYDAARGGYQDNVVVVARPTGPLRSR